MIGVGLRCAHRDNPLGVASDRVRFSWRLDGGDAQSKYQIQVFPNGPSRLPAEPAVVWDSGAVASSECSDIPYDGPALVSGGDYAWRVRVWDTAGSAGAGSAGAGSAGAAGDWSESASFSVELAAADWRASWIGLGLVRESFTPPSGDGPSDPVANALHPAPHLRRVFAVGQPVVSARLHVTALGLYEARLNGQRVGDACLTPGWTDYDRRLAYQTYDVTGLLTEGENVLGAVLADGWYAGFVGFDAKRAGAHYGAEPELLAQLVLDFADGSREAVGTDAGWHGRFGAVRHADLLMGERHDLRLELGGWDAPGFGSGSGSGWRPVRCRALDGRPLVADPGPPIRVTEEIAPVSIARDQAGRLIVDFGQNLTGWVRLRLAGGPGGAGAAAGTAIRVRHGEVLDADGFLYTENLRSARATDEYVTAGSTTGNADTSENDRVTVLQPRFTLHGFRYAEITGYPGSPGPGDIVARVAHSDIAPAGSFESSAEWLDRLFRAVDWGQRGNFISVPTDCPQRDERLGWLGDAQIFARTACYNRDVAAFYGKWLDDVADAQFPSGAYPDIAPRLNLTWAGAPAWADAGVIVPWTVWKMYGDRGVLERHFGAMTAWMDFIARGNPDHLRTAGLGNSYNDWLSPGRDGTPPELLATAYWAHDAALMTQIATALGRGAEAAEYAALREKIGAAFAAAFVADDGTVASHTQTAYALGLHMGLVPAGARDAAASHLVAAIAAADWHLTTGFAGVGYLLPVLSATGHSAIAYRLLAQRSLPSWRYMLDHGATTIWERWDGWSDERGFQSAWMNSFNHYSLGSVVEWLYRFLLGIDQQPGTSGFGRLLIRPHPGGELGRARGTYRSVRGPITSSWQRHEGQFTFRLRLPPNVTASVRIPSADPAAVRDDAGQGPLAIAGYPGTRGSREAVFEAGPGRHGFSGPGLDA